MTTSERDVYAFGQRVKIGKRWYSVTSTPHPHRAGCFVWRDGCTYTVPELVNWREERRIAEAPLPPEPDPLRGYIVVVPMA